jgi:protein TonB
MGESPLGSGFARAVREAAWQFRVLPPRINGQPVIGAWVRIRITYGVEAEPEG